LRTVLIIPRDIGAPRRFGCRRAASDGMRIAFRFNHIRPTHPHRHFVEKALP